jgi:HSP20 family molecular chaperone IbpA
MNITLHRDPRSVVPDLIEWFEEPFLGLRPYLGQPIRIEDYTQDGRYVVRAEIAGVDPGKDLDVSVGGGYLSIRAERSSSVEGKHRSEFRYGSFSRILQLPASADPQDVSAEYANGILTINVALRGDLKEAVKKVPVTAAK